MPRQWNTQLAQTYWAQRHCYTITFNPNVQYDIVAMNDNVQERFNREQQDKLQFFAENERFLNHDTPKPLYMDTAEKLLFWIRNSSWTYCENCKSLKTQKLLPTFENTPPVKRTTTCSCRQQRYVCPLYREIPDALRNLTFADIVTLRPFNIHIGNYERLQHGYRKKTGMFRVTPSTDSVYTKINNLSDENAKMRCLSAYAYLMNCQDSSYKHFVEKAQECIENQSSFMIYNFQETDGIECCLWPNLYPYTSWCESIITGNETRKSGKIAFMTKAFSEIVDYSLYFELLQFQYDRWLYKTVTGAISSGRYLHCSPARALDAKTFSPGYWKWQHRFLLDALRQFGFPSVFVTLSPYEWSFPFPCWLQAIRNTTGRGPTMLAGLETMHIARTLEQIVRGYLCGSNTNRWRKHVFNYNNIANMNNINTYFYRFEFQKRGTVHLHLLVWLKNIAHITHSLLRADIPWDCPDAAYLVQKLQRSDKSALQVNNQPTQPTEINGQRSLRLYHPPEAFALNLRAFISSLLPALHCHMDVQLTDGKGMILRYVTSYVSKWHDAYSNDGLYSVHVTPYQAAFRHLREMTPCEPEMWLQLSSMKHAWSCSRTKKYTVPTSETVLLNRTHIKYINRPATMEKFSLLHWLRLVNEKPGRPSLCKSGNTLVGLQLLSPKNPEYFFQYTLINVPHRDLTELRHRDYDRLPNQVKFFASAVAFRPDLWCNSDAVRELFESEGHKNYYVYTLVSFVSSLHDLLYLWQKQVFRSNNLVQSFSNSRLRFPADVSQQVILNHIELALHKRDQYYREISFFANDSDDEQSENEDYLDVQIDTDINASESPIDWRKFLLVTGAPGAGKTQTLLACIDQQIERRRSILVVTPTGFLATRYRNQFGDDITTDTIHARFLIPVTEGERPSINWSIADFDLLVVDEISMVPKAVFEHVIRTVSELTVRPIVLLSGDKKQQQPIHTLNNKTTATNSILSDPCFYSLVYIHNLTSQYRCADPTYQRFLDHIRNWIPTQELLDEIQHGRVICTDGGPSDDKIEKAVISHSMSTVLTISRRACEKINAILIKALFSDSQPLAVIKCDCDMDFTPIYKGMRVMITQNRDKENSVVNGQEAFVHSVHNNTVFLQLPSGSIVNTHPVTSLTQTNAYKIVYPFMPSYALTICKAQGQTLASMLLWFDVDTVPMGTAYVALSRIKRLEQLYLLTPLKQIHFKPVMDT